MKWKIIILLILFLEIVLADSGIIETYKPNQIFPLKVHLTNSTGDVSGANCSSQVRNSSFNVINNIQLQEQTGGWYNASYNNSRTGNYNCRHNCTIGTSYSSGTCDFIIQGDAQTPIAIMIGMGIVIAVLFTLSRYAQIEALKYLLISIGTIITILTLAIGLFLSKDSLPQSVQNLISTAYIILTYTMDFILAIGILLVILYTASKLVSAWKFRKYGKKN